MKIVEYLFRKVVPLFFGALCFFAFILLLVDLMMNLWNYISNGVSGLRVARIMLLYLPKTVWYSTPIAILFAVSYTLSDLYASNELVAIFASGISLRKFAFPLLVFAFLLSVGLFLFDDKVVVPTYARKVAEQDSALNKEKSENNDKIVVIGENGNIVLSEGVFFDVGSSAIKAGAIPTLNQLIDVFQRFLSDPDNVKYVDSIVISGHTDSTGTDENNRVLSTDRANAVLGYLLDNGGGKLQQYASYFCAAGYGETRPVADNETEEGRAQNRRIEISIILKDDSVLDIVESYLDIDVPESVQNRANPGS